MTALLVAVGVPVAAFAALVAGVWRHRATRHHGRHVAPTGAISRDVHDYTVPIAHTRGAPPWDDAPEPGPGWVADLRAALDEVEPSGWVKPELHHILAAPTLAGEWLAAEPYRYEPPPKDHPNDVDSPNEWVNAVLPIVLAGELDLAAALAASPQTAEIARKPDTWGGESHAPSPVMRGISTLGAASGAAPEPSRLADTADHHGIALALDVADYMAAQDADATRYGGDLADWCARQLRELRETLCPRR